MNQRIALMMLALLPLTQSAVAQEAGESCLELMVRTEAQVLYAEGEGTNTEDSWRRSELFVAPEEGDAEFVGVNSYFDQDGQLARVTRTQLSCAGDVLLVHDTRAEDNEGQVDFHTRYSPPLPLISLSLDEAALAWEGTLSYEDEVASDLFVATQTGTVMEAETVETPAGSYETQHVRLMLTLSEGASTAMMQHDSWYVTEPFYIVPRSSTTRGGETELWTVRSITMADGEPNLSD